MPRSANSNPLRFGIITDIHFSTERETAAADATAAEIGTCMEFWQRHNVDFLLQLGDLINGTDDHKYEELRQISSILQQFPVTIRHVIGNHCLALPRLELMEALGLQSAYYTFTMQGFRFMVLDGMEVSMLRTPEREEDRHYIALFQAHPELHDYCGAVGTRQKAWLQNGLEEAERSGEKVIIICHFPLLPETTDQRHGLLWNHREIAELLAASPAVKACISGHYHYGSYGQLNGLHFLVLPAFVNRSAHPGFTCGTAELSGERMVIRNQLDETLYDFFLRH